MICHICNKKYFLKDCPCKICGRAGKCPDCQMELIAMANKINPDLFKKNN